MNDELEFRSRRRRIVLLLMASAFLVWQVPGIRTFSMRLQPAIGVSPASFPLAVSWYGRWAW